MNFVFYPLFSLPVKTTMKVYNPDLKNPLLKAFLSLVQTIRSDVAYWNKVARDLERFEEIESPPVTPQVQYRLTCNRAPNVSEWISAVKLVRAMTGLGLKESTDKVLETIEKGRPITVLPTYHEINCAEMTLETKGAFTLEILP